MSNPESLCHALLDAARKAGADAADVLVVSERSSSISVRQGALEEAEGTESIDLGLRVLMGQRQACVSSTDTSLDTLTQMAERAVATAKDAPEDPNIGLADPSQLGLHITAEELELCDTADPVSAADLQECALRAEAAALEVDGVSQTQGATAAQSRRDIFVGATNGLAQGYQRSDIMTSCVAISGEGLSMEREYDGDYRVFSSDLRSPEDIGTKAGVRAASRIGVRRPPTGNYPVVYDERVATSLIGHLLGTIDGANVARGNSWLLDALGTQVLPEGLSIIEDPHRARVSNSRPFDAEGLPTQRRAIVENGVLQGWTMDLANARKLGFESTASARRSTTAPPYPGLSNIALTQGEKSQADLLKDMGTGLLITSMIGSTINPNTGDYSRGASGFWVENGEITYPVNECTVAGNLKDMLKTIQPANDARSYAAYVIPSLLVEGLALAGA